MSCHSNFVVVKQKEFCRLVSVLLVLTSMAVADQNRFASQTLKTEELFDTKEEWGAKDMCPENYFISGVRLHFQPYQGSEGTFGKVLLGITTLGWFSTYNNLARNNDDLGLLGIELLCWPYYTKINTKFPDLISVTSKVGTAHQSVWSNALYCNSGFAIGFQLRVQPRQYSGDDHAATNFKLLCSSGKELYFQLPYEVGDWPRNGYKTCKKNAAICGLKTKVEESDITDRHGLEAVEIYCCDLPIKTAVEQAMECIPRRDWELIVSHDNTEGKIEYEQSYTEKTGISGLTSTRTLMRDSQSEANAQTWGIDSETSLSIKMIAKVALRQNFQKSFNNSMSKDFESEKLLTNSLNSEVEHKVNFKVPPGYISKIYQLVGHCGPFAVHSKAFKRVDISPRGNKHETNLQPDEGTY